MTSLLIRALAVSAHTWCLIPRAAQHGSDATAVAQKAKMGAFYRSRHLARVFMHKFASRSDGVPEGASDQMVSERALRLLQPFFARLDKMINDLNAIAAVPTHWPSAAAASATSANPAVPFSTSLIDLHIAPIPVDHDRFFNLPKDLALNAETNERSALSETFSPRYELCWMSVRLLSMHTLIVSSHWTG